LKKKKIENEGDSDNSSEDEARQELRKSQYIEKLKKKQFVMELQSSQQSWFEEDNQSQDILRMIDKSQTRSLSISDVAPIRGESVEVFDESAQDPYSIHPPSFLAANKAQLQKLATTLKPASQASSNFISFLSTGNSNSNGAHNNNSNQSNSSGHSNSKTKSNNEKAKEPVNKKSKKPEKPKVSLFQALSQYENL